MDLVSEISNSYKTCNAKSENTIGNYVFRQEIAAYHNQIVYHTNNLPPTNADGLILGNPVRDSFENPSNISSNIRSPIIVDKNQRMVTRASQVLPENYVNQTNQRIISPKHVMNNNIKTQSTKMDHQGMVTKTVSPMAPLIYLQQSNHPVIDPEQASCSRDPRRTPRDPPTNDGTSNYLSQSPRINVGENKFAEKTTYCRPAVDPYSKQFIHGTVQKNARLQVLVKRLAHMREKEKQRLAWNNYITSLRNKHMRYKRSESIVADSIPEYTNLSNSEIVENNMTRPPCPKLRQSPYMLEDYQSALNYGNRNMQYHPTPKPFNSNGPNYTLNSQERGMMLNFELPRYDYPHHTIPRHDYPTTLPTVLDETRHQLWINEKDNHKIPPQLKFTNVNESDVRNMSVQTNTSMVSANSEKEISPYKSLEHNQDTHNNKQDSTRVEIIKKKHRVSELDVKYSQLSTIDRKLDELISSINNFIGEIKSQKQLINMTNKREAINQTKSSSYLVKCDERGKKEFKTMQDRAVGTISLYKENPQETLYTILTEEQLKSDIVKRDIENMINKPNRSSSSLHITFDIPTKDSGIEIKDSFKVDPRSIGVKEMSEDKRMTIAVNTDPMGLLALFRVSAEAVKQLLSFMPSIDYNLMSMLPLPAAKSLSHYVCNICGAVFDRPSRLSDHIQRHTLGKTRDCCVCRHALDRARQSGLFTCRHCGQNFTRAYCRELHQISCARALGKKPEDSSSHLILR